MTGGVSQMGTTAVGRLGVVAIDCPEPRVLAEFYRGVVGGEPEGDDEWVTLQNGADVSVAFQRADEWTPPVWPGADSPQQAHLDVYVPDLDEGERRVLALGARKAEYQPGTSFRVYLDPVGHPFCLCVG
jgi:hypothetical protein